MASNARKCHGIEHAAVISNAGQWHRTRGGGIQRAAVALNGIERSGSGIERERTGGRAGGWAGGRGQEGDRRKSDHDHQT